MNISTITDKACSMGSTAYESVGNGACWCGRQITRSWNGCCKVVSFVVPRLLSLGTWGVNGLNSPVGAIGGILGGIFLLEKSAGRAEAAVTDTAAAVAAESGDVAAAAAAATAAATHARRIKYATKAAYIGLGALVAFTAIQGNVFLIPALAVGV